MPINFPCAKCGGFHAVDGCDPDAALVHLSGMLALPGLDEGASATEDEQIRRYLGRRRRPKS